MLAAHAVDVDARDPLRHLAVGDVEVRPGREVPQDWVRVAVRAAALNHHDLWSLRGASALPASGPRVLGTDAAGVTDDGREVIVHAVLGRAWLRGDETLDPRRSLLSEQVPGTLAEHVWVPAENLVDKPEALDWDAAACLPTAWLTAYRMLATQADVRPGDTVLVQGSGGGVATAAVLLGTAMGLRVWVTGREPARRERAVALGAAAAFAPGDRLPERVDAVLDSVGAATWSHSLRSLRPGGRLVLCGATSGPDPVSGELARIFFTPLTVVGSTMGTRAELEALARWCASSGPRPPVDSRFALADARAAFERLASGEAFGKVVIHVEV